MSDSQRLPGRVMDVQEFMSELNIKSLTTFNEKAKAPGFPVAIEWPPKSKKRDDAGMWDDAGGI